MTVSVGYDDLNSPGRRLDVMAASAAFWAWCGLLSFPMIGVNIDLTEIYNPVSRLFLVSQVVGLTLFLITMCLTHSARVIPAMGRFSLPQVAIFFIIYLSLVLQLHDGEAASLMGILYTCLLLVTALMLSVLWTLAPADLARCMGVASVILCLFGISAIVILGLPQGRAVGYIQPNLFATPLLAAFVFSQFRPGIIGVAVRILCFSMVALVSSRFALIGCVLALVVHELTFKPLGWRKLSLLIFFLLAGLVFWPQIIGILALDDPTRDLSSGFSGRDDQWRAALAAITDDPFGIGYKRAMSDESGHNGYLRILLEFGVLGGGLIIFLTGCVVVMAGVEAVVRAGKDPQQHRFACARFGGLVALAFGAFFQPQLLNFGDTFGISVLFLLFKPKMQPIADRSFVLRFGIRSTRPRT
jgi:hypothetical protein